MSSSSNVQKSSDVEISNAAGASSSGLPAVGAIQAHIAEFLSLQSEFARHEAEQMVNPTHGVSPKPAVPVGALNPEVPPARDDIPARGVVVADASAPEVEVQPSGSSTTPVHESMPPPPAKRVIVLGLPTPTAISDAMPKS
ncbi:hypothetical protein F2Q68_00044031 [Brassica cretica]|uniref:Uncharacterized protein n=1 Tax=Brassica cretica TaxID=69181 RepID=A0A8S9LKT4_BRACR|nr:hypothetical protein F2Q68_00044031 [Brassica cretica]